MLYWSIGRDILAQQQAAGWGDDIVGRIAEDLRAATGSARGFSRRNVFYMRRFAAAWPDTAKVPSVMAQIPWTGHRVLLDRFAEQPDVYVWYAAKAAANRWSVRHLQAQISLELHERQGAALTNFDAALAPADAEQALQATKDPYVFDFLELADDARERELEQALIDDIQRFLLELGSGFAFYGRQLPVVVGDQEFFLDLLFYHHNLRRFVVIELKIGDFEPEYVSKMNFYLNAVDQQLRVGDDRESVGIILCAGRNETIARLALHRVYSPIAVSTWQTTNEHEQLPTPDSAEEASDREELAELDDVRARLIERVSQRATEISRDET
jgi:predicted nuclease of restriction endonuclease-like (RecB) superfamily